MVETNFLLKTDTTIAAIKSWWEAFQSHQDDFDKQFAPHSTHGFDVAGFMDQHFAQIHPDMCWEFTQGISQAHLLAIAPERNAELEPLAKLIVSLAPTLDKFEIVVNRQHTEWDVYRSYSDGRLNWSGPDGILFDVQKGQNNLFDVIFYVPHTSKADDIYSACFITCETLLGEETMSKWVGLFDVEKLPKTNFFTKQSSHSKNLKLLKFLRQTLAENIAQLKNSLSDSPFVELPEDTKWSLLEMKPKEQTDYEPLRDLITALSPSVELFNGYYSNRTRFYSERFTKFNETFIFVQMDGSSDDLSQEVFKDRGEIEDALEAALSNNTIGKVIGGGTGRKYSYIHLATLDVSEAINRVKQTLRNGKITRRAWIMFHDADRQQEWIGVWDDTPAPKLASLD